MKKLLLASILLVSFNAIANASSSAGLMITNIENSNQLKCSFIKTTPQLFSVKDSYECRNLQGEVKAVIKIVSEAFNRGQLLEIGKVKKFEVTFKQ